MSVAFDYRGFTYDTAVPQFVVISDAMVFDRENHQAIRRDSLPVGLVDPEIGNAPQWWIDANDFVGETQAVTGAPITASASAIVTDTSTITFAGGPADQIYTATATIDTGTGDQVFANAGAAGDTATDFAAVLAAETLVGGTLTQNGRSVIVIDDAGTLVKCQIVMS